MASVLPVDLDYLVARLHGRRGHLAEGDRLDALCALRSLPDLVRALTPHALFTSVAEFQQELILDMVQELADFAAQLTGAGSALMAWMRVRVQIENLKVLARAFATGKSGAVARKYLLPLPPDLALDFAALSVADSLESFIAATPSGVLRQELIESAPEFDKAPRALVLEAALDRAYFRELLKRTKALPHEARTDALAIARHEVDTFHLMVVARGRFTYDLPAERLAWLHVPGGGISRDRFGRMLEAATLRDAAQEAAAFVLPALLTDKDLFGTGWTDPDPAILEPLTWNRYDRLARRAFRRSHMGLGAVVAFAALRRVEVANLITVSEGIRTETPPDVIRRRLISGAKEVRDV
jgi:vacuolar-type H+-ATPase subunit C/Vma6